MNRRKPPTRTRRSEPLPFSKKLQTDTLRRSVSESGAVVGVSSTKVESLGIRRSHFSAPTVPVNQSGKFNYDLKRTGFLTDMKMRAKRIAQNPKRFLEAYAESRDVSGFEQEFVPLEVPKLEDFIQNLALDSHLVVKDAELKERSKSAKFRTFLLAMSSTSSLELDPRTLAFLHSYSAGEDEISSTGTLNSAAYEDAQEMEVLVKHYLDQIKTMDTTPIQDWVSEFLNLSDLELAHGLPLNIPTQLPSEIGEFGDCSEIIKFVESSQDDFILLDGEYHTKVEQITKELEINFKLLHQDWTTEELGLLFYVLNSFTSATSVTSVILPLQIELTQRLFPGKSQNEITKQKFRLKTKKSLEEKRMAVIRGWVHDKQELQLKMNIAWQEVSKKRLAEMEKKLSFKKQKDICEFWTERLQKMRKEKCEQIKKLKILTEPTEKFREKGVKSISESEALRREAVKAEVIKFKNQRSDEITNQMKLKHVEQQMEQEAMKQRLIVNKKRVSYRKGQQNLKEKAKREVEAELEEQRRLREEKLEQTKEPVEIEYNPENVIAETHASMVRRFETVKDYKKLEDERMASVFRECYSFSAETVLKDRRIRFQAKLKEAGLLDSSYARQVLLAMEPKPKPHLQSQVKLSDDA